jgi:uncharacterized protein involved in outer membrane biogenesis
LHPITQWSDISRRARGLAERGRSSWRDARERLRALGPSGGGRSHVEPVPAPADGTAALAVAPPVGRPWAWTGAVVSALIIAIVVLMAIWDWDWFRGPVGRWASAQSHHTVTIDGHIKVHLLTWAPQATVGNLRIANPAWAGPGDVASVRALTVRVRLMPLLKGQVDLPLVDIEHPDLHLFSDAQGRSNWRSNQSAPEQPLKLPPIQHLIIRDGHIAMTVVRRKFHLTGTVASEEDTPGSGRGNFNLAGRGDLNGEPFVLRISGGPLIDVRRDRPYRFDGELRAGPTRLTAQGSIDKPFDFGRFHARLTGSGSDLADLYKITSLTFPNTPPYSATGLLSRDGDRFSYSHFTGRVGDSDLAGDLTVEKQNGRRFLKGNLVSRSLDWKDLAQVLGTAPLPSKGASPVQKAASHALAATGRMMPDAPIYMDRLRAMDADVQFRATAVKANLLRLTAVKLGVKLHQGVLVVDPLTFGFSQGVLSGRVKVDGRGAIPVTDTDLRLSNYALQNALRGRGGEPAATGLVDGHASLHGVGRSVREVAQTSAGTVSFSVPHGEIRQAFAELLGVNAGNGLSLLLAKDQRKTELRCAVADFDVKGGVMHARNIVIDTGVVTSQGEGTINLGDETLNLRLKGKSKKVRLLKLWTPIEIKGSLSRPKIGVSKSSIGAQAGVALGIGALLNPLAAVLPFISLGGAKDVDCAALLARRAPAQSAR